MNKKKVFTRVTKFGYESPMNWQLPFFRKTYVNHVTRELNSRARACCSRCSLSPLVVCFLLEMTTGGHPLVSTWREATHLSPSIPVCLHLLENHLYYCQVLQKITKGSLRTTPSKWTTTCRRFFLVLHSLLTFLFAVTNRERLSKRRLQPRKSLSYTRKRKYLI